MCTYLYSQGSGCEATEAALGVLLARQARHRTPDEVDEAAVSVVLHHAAQRQDHHGYCVWNEKMEDQGKTRIPDSDPPVWILWAYPQPSIDFTGVEVWLWKSPHCTELGTLPNPESLSWGTAPKA